MRASGGSKSSTCRPVSIFYPLGFMRFNINYTFLLWLWPGLNCGKWWGLSFSHYLAVRLGSNCRAAEDLHSRASVAPISVILSWSTHKNHDCPEGTLILRQHTFGQHITQSRSYVLLCGGSHTYLAIPDCSRIQFHKTLKTLCVLVDSIMILTNKTPHEL